MFCKHCGHEVDGENAYCTVCGAYLKKKPEQISVKTEEIQFCKHCGEKVTGRYCTKCGQFNMKVQPKIGGGTGQAMDFVKQAASQIKTEDIKNKLQGTAKSLEKGKFKEGIQESCGAINAKSTLEAIKQGLIFSGITLVIALIVAFLFSCGIEQNFDEIFSGISGSAIGQVGDLKVSSFIMFMLLYGGSGTLHAAESGLLMKLGMTFPVSLLIITLLIFWVGEKIRCKLTKVNIKVYMIFIMSIVNGVLTTVIAACFGAYVNALIKDMMTGMLGLYMAASETSIRVGINIGHTFMTAALLSFVCLLLFNAKDILGERFKAVAAISKGLFGMLYLCAFCPALIIGIRLFLTADELNIIAIIQVVLSLSVVILIAILTCNISLLKAVCNGKKVASLTMGVFNFKMKSALGNYTVSNPFKVYLIIFMLIALIVTIYYSLRLWREKESSFKEALWQSGMGACLIAAISSLASRMLTVTTHMYLKDAGDEFLQGINNLKVSYSIFNTNWFAIFVAVFLFVFIVFIIGYLLMTYTGEALKSLMSISHGKIVAGLCAAIIAISVIGVTTFDAEWLRDSGFLMEMQDMGEELGDALSDLSLSEVTDYLNY